MPCRRRNENVCCLNDRLIAGLPRALAYSNNFLLLEYSLLSIFGLNVHFRWQLLQSFDELFVFIDTWGFAISFATCQPGNRSKYMFMLFEALTLRALGTLTHHPLTSSLAACIKVGLLLV